MKQQRTSARSIALCFTALFAATIAGADNPKKPAAVAASKSSATSGATTKTKPAAVAASTTQPSKRDEIELVHAKVNIKDTKDDYGIYHKVYDFSDQGTDIIIKIRGQEYELKGMDAAQLLTREGYIVYRDGVGLIAADKLKKHLGIKDSSTSGGGGAAGSGRSVGSSSFMGTSVGPDIKPKTDMVEPAKTESVAEDPSQEGSFGGLLGADFEVDSKCMAGRDKMYSDCTERCKEPGSGDYGECVKKCSKDALAAWGDCDAPARTRADEWE